MLYQGALTWKSEKPGPRSRILVSPHLPKSCILSERKPIQSWSGEFGNEPAADSDGDQRANMIYDVERIGFSDDKINRRLSSEGVCHYV